MLQNNLCNEKTFRSDLKLVSIMSEGWGSNYYASPNAGSGGQAGHKCGGTPDIVATTRCPRWRALEPALMV